MEPEHLYMTKKIISIHDRKCVTPCDNAKECYLNKRDIVRTNFDINTFIDSLKDINDYTIYIAVNTTSCNITKLIDLVNNNKNINLTISTLLYCLNITELDKIKDNIQVTVTSESDILAVVEKA